MQSEINLVKYMLADEQHLNIWTIRFTVTEDYNKMINNDPGTEGPPDPNSPIIKYFSNKCPKLFPKILFYLEVSKQGKKHYHIRIGTSIWKTRKSIFDSIHKFFPFAKGNKIFSTKAVRVNGVLKSSPEKSITYISKDKNLIFSRGYSGEAIAKFEVVGSMWIDIKKLPIFKQIIHQKSITQQTPGHVVVRAVLDYYKDEGRDAPTYFNLQKTLTNIKLNVDPDYREAYLMRGANFYDNLEHSLGY